MRTLLFFDHSQSVFRSHRHPRTTNRTCSALGPTMRAYSSRSTSRIGRPPQVTTARSSRSSSLAGQDALAPYFRLLELGGGNRPVESGAQLLGGLQRQLDPRPCAGAKVGVNE